MHSCKDNQLTKDALISCELSAISRGKLQISRYKNQEVKKLPYIHLDTTCFLIAENSLLTAQIIAEKSERKKLQQADTLGWDQGSGDWY